MREVCYPNFNIRFDPDRHRYWLDGERVPSVTGIVGEVCTPPFGMPAWWGMKIGVEGVCKLYADSHLYGPDEGPNGFYWWLNPDETVKRLTAAQLTVNHVRGKAGARGTGVHIAAQRFAEFGEPIDPNGFPEEEMGYVAALRDWFDTTQPTVIDSEQIVGSKRLGYAGTLDLRAHVEDRMGIVDFKTTGGIRNPSVDYQLAMYELASIDCGYPPTDFRAILRLDEDGTWEWYESPTPPTAVEPLLEVWEERKRIDEHVKARKAAA